jgi:hypothetical protein
MLIVPLVVPGVTLKETKFSSAGITLDGGTVTTAELLDVKVAVVGTGCAALMPN